MKKLIIYILILLCLYSCKTTKYVEVPKEIIKTEYKTNIKYDSIYVKDSISIKAVNDTIFIEKTKIYNKYKNIVDTIIKVDTLKETKVITNEVTKEVNHLKSWQVLLMIIGSISIFYMILKLLNRIKY